MLGKISRSGAISVLTVGGTAIAESVGIKPLDSVLTVRGTADAESVGIKPLGSVLTVGGTGTAESVGIEPVDSGLRTVVLTTLLTDDHIESEVTLNDGGC